MKKTYAFWRYNQYPYFLGGLIDKDRSSGNLVYVPSHQGYFNPILTCDGDEGLELMEKLKHLRIAHLEALLDLRTDFAKLLSEVAPEISDKI